MFQLKWPNGLGGEVKNWFSKWRYGGHFGFPIGMILAIFHLHVNLLLHYKFQLNLPWGLQEDEQNRFSIWPLWRPAWISDRHDFSSFRSSCPVITEQVLDEIHQRFGKKCRKLIFKMAAMAAIIDFHRLINFSYFVSTRRPDAPFQVSTQLDHSL